MRAMAGRSLLALSRASRKTQVPIALSSNNNNVRFVSQVVYEPCVSSPMRKMGVNVGILDGCNVRASFRAFSVVETGNLGFLVAPWSVCSGKRGAGLVSYSSLALETREDSRENVAEIGYTVLGPYVSDGAKIKPQAAFAVVQVGSHQFKVSAGDMIYTEKLKHADVNDQLSLNKVLLLGSLKQTVIGRPIIPEAAVIAAVEEHALDAKVIVFKKKRRKNYRRTNGHRQELTRLRILRIEGIDDTIPVGVDTSPVKGSD